MSLLPEALRESIAMTEPTAESLKAAQEWLQERGIAASPADVKSLAALLASREQALREEIERLKEGLACQDCREYRENCFKQVTDDRKRLAAAEAEAALLMAVVGEWRKAESAVDCEACAVIGASLPEGVK